MRDRRLLFVAPRAHWPDFGALFAAWSNAGVQLTRRAYTGAPPDADKLSAWLERNDALLLAGSSRYAPSTVLPGPFLQRRDGGRVPAAWLPLRSHQSTQRFATAAARVHSRPRAKVAVALLGQWHPRYRHVTDRVESLLAGRVPTLRWTADLIDRDNLLSALGGGLGLGLYLGHGRSMGWVGYQGVRGQHFESYTGEPLGAMFSLCCRTASRRRVGLSYAEALPLQGVAAASFGAIDDSLHTDNTRWAIGLCDALTQGVTTVGELVVRAAPAAPQACAPYRLIGDPLAPLTSARRALARASAVLTYP